MTMFDYLTSDVLLFLAGVLQEDRFTTTKML